ncbi:hypothetical protein Nmel_009266 [Mimus melanotis]
MSPDSDICLQPFPLTGTCQVWLQKSKEMVMAWGELSTAHSPAPGASLGHLQSLGPKMHVYSRCPLNQEDQTLWHLQVGQCQFQMDSQATALIYLPLELSCCCCLLLEWETLRHTEGDHQTGAEILCFPAALSVKLLREAGSHIMLPTVLMTPMSMKLAGNSHPLCRASSEPPFSQGNNA